MRHFARLNSGKGKNYTVQTITSFSEKNVAEGIILKETLPNGVTRLQLPREAWHNQTSFGNARFATDTQKWKGIKTLWPSNFTISDIAEAAEQVLAQNPSAEANTIEGIYKGIRTVVTRDQAGKVIIVYPKWIQ